ncbi:hypothetical protein V2J09_020185 [Rumex salicifolius]
MSACAGVISRQNMVHYPSGYFYDRLDIHSIKSILVYLTVFGCVIPIWVLESDSIASLKLKIQKFKGFVVKNQKLVFRGRELARNDCLVKDYGITGGKRLHLIVKLSDLLAITVKTVCWNDFEVQIGRHRNVGYLKKRIFKEGNGFVDLQHEDQELFYNGERLEDQRLIHDIWQNCDAVVHLVAKKPVEIVSRKTHSREFSLTPVVVNPKVKLSSVILNLIDSAIQGLANGKQPIQSTEGTGGAYFMSDVTSEKYVAIFKPIDEEPMAINNPRGLPVSLNGEGLKRGTKVGEGAFREVGAYILDHPKSGPRSLTGEVMGFSGVPPTTMVKCLHKGFNYPQGFENVPENEKLGSLQMFVENDGSCEEMGPQSFPVEEVHKISVLDIRLANADRHAGNILVKKGKGDGKITLIPIDHGYCLPEKFEDCTFDWLYWPQARQPYSPETIEYIKSLNTEQDIALLNFHGWDVPIECARTLHISTMLLKKGAEMGMTPFSIGSIMCRQNINKESMIEEIVHEAQESLLLGMSEASFLEAVSGVMDRRLTVLGK